MLYKYYIGDLYRLTVVFDTRWRPQSHESTAVVLLSRIPQSHMYYTRTGTYTWHYQGLPVKTRLKRIGRNYDTKRTHEKIPEINIDFSESICFLKEIETLIIVTFIICCF